MLDSECGQMAQKIRDRERKSHLGWSLRAAFSLYCLSVGRSTLCEGGPDPTDRHPLSTEHKVSNASESR